MPRRAPWNSVKEPVHHNNSECNTGNNIETENLRQGEALAWDASFQNANDPSGRAVKTVHKEAYK